jgi:hypothetical protein
MNQPTGATLASVLHLRLADFGSKAVVEQARLRAQLEAVVATSLSAVPERDRIVLDAPDGLAVAVLGNPDGAFKLAQRCLEAAPVLPLCIGAHHGAVAAGGTEDTQGLLGDGLRSAGVAATFAKPAQILVTRAFKDALAAHVPSREAELRRAGMFADDSVRTYELFIADRDARRQRRKWLVLTGLACIVIGSAAGFGVRLYESGVIKFPAKTPPQIVAQQPAAPAATTTTPPAAAATAPAVAAPKPEPRKAAPAKAVLTFEVSPGGDIYVDGKLRGSIPEMTRLELPPGRYRVEIRFRKEDPFQRDYVLKAGQQVTVQHVFFAPERFFKKIFK